MIQKRHRYDHCPCCQQELTNWQENLVQTNVSWLNQREQRRAKAHADAGQSQAFVAAALVGLLVWWAVSSLWVLVAIILAIVFGLPMIKEQSKMKEAILRITGIRIINMKLQALAAFLKVQFVHVPEHYECEKIQ